MLLNITTQHGTHTGGETIVKEAPQTWQHKIEQKNQDHLIKQSINPQTSISIFKYCYEEEYPFNFDGCRNFCRKNLK